MQGNNGKENQQDSASASISASQINEDLIRLAGRLSDQAMGIAHANYNLGAIVIICTVLIISAVGWTSFRSEQIADQQVRVINHVWELKTALGLKFSQERNAAKVSNAKAETEMP